MTRPSDVRLPQNLAARWRPRDDLRMLTSERRIARSSRPEVAIHLFLEHARERLGVRALALSTADGSLLAGAGEDLDRVARLGAEAQAGVATAERVATWRMCMGDDVLLLTSSGRAMDPDLGAGVRRILAA
jgi:hypothetical protein